MGESRGDWQMGKEELRDGRNGRRGVLHTGSTALKQGVANRAGVSPEGPLPLCRGTLGGGSHPPQGEGGEHKARDLPQLFVISSQVPPVLSSVFSQRQKLEGAWGLGGAPAAVIAE